jgi:hypothetical protein
MMLLILLVSLAAVATAATIRTVALDGYRRAPCCPASTLEA